MKIFNGKKISENILKDLKSQIHKGKKKPTLAIIYVGRNSESDLYIKNKKAAAEKIGLKVFCHRFKENIPEKEIIAKIKKNNDSSSVNGIIVQLPLPKKFNTDKIINSINPRKDVDGFHQINRDLLKKNNPYFYPVLPLAISIALNSATKNLKNKKIVALVNSDIFGQTLNNFFKRIGIKIKHLTGEINLSLLKSADVIISVRGNPGFIKREMIKEKAILIDAGIKITANRLEGDVDKKSVANKASFLTPVPGGIGPLTVALLLRNVCLTDQNYDFRS